MAARALANHLSLNTLSEARRFESGNGNLSIVYYAIYYLLTDWTFHTIHQTDGPETGVLQSVFFLVATCADINLLVVTHMNREKRCRLYK
jgi:hypothetical protein